MRRLLKWFGGVLFAFMILGSLKVYASSQEPVEPCI